jgi:phosphatidylserine/phosphatidylglycerophosphate/cardiolipin synthase-like enzyme
MLKARAIAGTHVVILAWDLKPGQKAKLAGLLGFALERSELKADGSVAESYWMRGIKRFKDKDKGLPAGTPVSTFDHPIQAFQWGDYTAKSGRHYRYRIVPLHGQPKHLTADAAAAVVLDVRTERDATSAADPAAPPIRHDIYFNRGVIGSQAYARDFGNATPDIDDPGSPEMVWLSHGLYEALMAFIGRATDQRFGLRAAVYEFHYQPVVNAFAAAVGAGADVKIVYDAESSYKGPNEQAIAIAGLDADDAVIRRTVSEGIRHNKFIVLLQGGAPVAVWTGSTNISAGGIFGHSNVGHVVWDAAIARQYLDYWTDLAKNLTCTRLRPINNAKTPTPVGKPPKNSVTPLFSARDALSETTAPATLQWYADRMAEARQLVCFTVAFNLDTVFQQVLARDNDVLRYIVKDDALAANETLGVDRDVIFAAGSTFGDGFLANFRSERGNPLNTNDYIHTKFMLVDPLSSDPLVVSGTANFSRPSQWTNDENMLVIRGDTRVADIYFGEYMRVFDHHYARYIVRKIRNESGADPNAGYLKQTSVEWTRSQFDPGSYKSKRRRYFVG